MKAPWRQTRIPVRQYQRWRTLRGYTLLELMLAASISVLVMAGISTMITLLYQVQTASTQRVSSAQLGRNLLRQLEWDLQSIPGQLPAAVAADTGTSSTDTSDTLFAAGEDSSTIVSSNEEAQAGYAYWLVGDAISVQFLTEPVRRTGKRFAIDLDPAAESDVISLRKRLVHWGLTDAQTLGMALDTTDPAAGTETLLRAEGFTDSLLSETDWFESTLVPEAYDLQFSYFDGTTWLESWDSETAGGLPKAIEVTLTLQPVNVATKRQNSFTAEPLPDAWTMTRILLLPTQRFVSAENSSGSTAKSSFGGSLKSMSE